MDFEIINNNQLIFTSMKKIIMILLAMCVSFGAINAAKQEKTAQKYAKQQAKEYAKQGWRVDGIFTLEEVFYSYRVKLLEPGNSPLTGIVSGETTTKTINQAKQWAATNAAITYSKEAGQMMRGRITSEIAADAGSEGQSLDNLYEGYESLVQKEIKGELHMSFGIFRETKKGIEYQAFYIVNENEASKARMRAMENMMKESEFARKHAEQISKFVQEGFQNAPVE